MVRGCFPLPFEVFMFKDADAWRFWSVLAGFALFLVLLAAQPGASPINPSTTSAYPVPQDRLPPRAGLASTAYRIHLPQLRGNGSGVGGSTAPEATRSRYIGTDYLRDAADLGRFTARTHPNGIVILAFGQPIVENLIPGTYLPGSTFFAAIDRVSDASDIRGAVQSYILGYCGEPLPVSARLTVAVGVSNFAADANGSNLSRTHGQQWGLMIKNVNDWLRQPANAVCNTQVDVAGAIDIEPDFGKYTPTRTWIDGYLSTAVSIINGANVPWEIYNFGSCDGCPTNSNPGGIPNNGWTVDNIYQVSAGIPHTRVIPQIYATNGVNAEQWYRISLHGATSYNVRIPFRGTMTQQTACADLDQPPECLGTNVSPAIGWTFLQNQIGSDTRTRLSSPIQWSTDISWRQVMN